MYHRIIILALLFFPSPGKTISLIFERSLMEISNALPVQFWLVGCDTYNEHQAAGVHHKCYCAPWQCDDIISFQGKDTPGKSFSMLIFSSQEEPIGEIPIEETSEGVYQLNYTPSSDSPEICDQLIQLKIQENAQELPVAYALPPLTDYDTTVGTPPTLDPLVDWINASSGPNPGIWTLSATPDVSVNGFFGGGGGGSGLSGYVCGAIATNGGFDYEFDVQFEFLASGGVNPKDVDVIFAILSASFNELDTVTFNYTTFGVKTPNFTLSPSSDGVYLGMRIVNNTPFDSHSFELQAASYTPGPTTHEWTLGATPSVDLFSTISTSETLWVDVSLTNGVEYTITPNFSLSVNSIGTFSLRVTDSSFVTQFSESTILGNSGPQVGDPLIFTANANTTRIAVRVSSVNAVTVTVNSITATLLQIIGTTQVLAKTDCLDIRQEHEDSILLTYSNHRNFAGLVYEDESPTNEFRIRIPSTFFHQRFPEEDEVMELSTSLVTLNGTVKKQRLLDTDYLPYYFHEKMKLILKHQILEIFDRQWVKQEAYEIVEGDRRWPLKKAKVWLSEKDFVHRNIL